MAKLGTRGEDGGMRGEEGGMHAEGGVCMLKGVACVEGGIYGRGCMAHTPPAGYYKMWSVNVQVVLILLECIIVDFKM